MSSTTGYEAALARLEPKQARFVTEYLVDLNATQAAIRAGYSKKGAAVQGVRLLTNAKVSEAVRLGVEKRAAKVEITADFVLGQMLKFASADHAELYNADGSLKNIHDIPKDVRMAIQSLEIEQRREGEDGPLVTTKKVKLVDKKGSNEILMKYLGLLKENVHITGNLRYAAISDAELEQRIAEAARGA